MRPITAADLMNPHVLTVREDLTVQELAAFLVRHQITGAPVENAHGRLVGVVSVSDIAEASLADFTGSAGAVAIVATAPRTEARTGFGVAGVAGVAGAAGVARSPLRERAVAAWSERRGAPAPAPRPRAGAGERQDLPEPADPAVRELEGDEELTVRDIMTPAVVSVAEDATVSEVASKMLDGHVHRLVVTRDDQPLGIITTSDLLGLLIDER